MTDTTCKGCKHLAITELFGKTGGRCCNRTDLSREILYNKIMDYRNLDRSEECIDLEWKEEV